MLTSQLIQTGDIIDHVAAGALTAGDIVFKGTIAGQVTSTVVTGQLGGLRVRGVIRLAKASGDVFAGGAAVHYNSATKLANTTTANGKLGSAVGGGAAGELFVDVLLNM